MVVRYCEFLWLPHNDAPAVCADIDDTKSTHIADNRTRAYGPLMKIVVDADELRPLVG